MRKRLDIYFIENKLISKALDEYYELMSKTLDTDDFISKKVDASIKEMIEAKFRADLKAIKKEVKFYLKKWNRSIKRGEIDYDGEFNNFLESLGVNFSEYSSETETEPLENAPETSEKSVKDEKQAPTEKTSSENKETV